MSTEFAGIQVEVLGSPRVRLADGTHSDLAALPGDLLATLVLAGPEGRSADWLRRELWSSLPVEDNNPVARAMMRLRKDVPIPKPRAGGNYVLAVPPDRIDALVFRDGVATLGSQTPATEVDALLGLWRGSPWQRKSRVRAASWAEIRRARDRLGVYVDAMPPQQRAELTHWHRFCGLFQHETEAWHGEAVPERPRRKQVLIVDDMIGEALARALGGVYDCEVVTSFTAWTEMLSQNHPLDYDCALVDRHLDENMADENGEIVLKNLRELRPAMPTALMSAELPFEDAESVKSRLGVRTVIPKHNDKDGRLVPLVELVEKLIGSG
ncbi:hypothetical protein [Streptomyces sp. cf386]|uniref:hypothetical protein n=1 Tax=Streptomyces sp. cf386 TaxID=1761904 RepID=UPI0015A2B152|nr:hypothetical protein [Streptomyces sp. cf386]